MENNITEYSQDAGLRISLDTKGNSNNLKGFCAGDCRQEDALKMQGRCRSIREVQSSAVDNIDGLLYASPIVPSKRKVRMRKKAFQAMVR